MMKLTKPNPTKTTKTTPVKPTPSKTVVATKTGNAVGNAVTIADDLKWQTEQDARTLESAEEIKKDPKRLQAATVFMEAKLEKIKSFVDMMKQKKS